ncbi:hypothetical protein [Lacipirellula sp.]|uniref:hypothetical protein n=1 Tax=Lacipirellula sp. TaxID=2691419 RepID=UPI003D0D9CB7
MAIKPRYILVFLVPYTASMALMLVMMIGRKNFSELVQHRRLMFLFFIFWAAGFAGMVPLVKAYFGGRLSPSPEQLGSGAKDESKKR